MRRWRRDSESGLLLPRTRCDLFTCGPAFFENAAPASNPWNTFVAARSPNIWLKMNETSGGTANDSSGNGLNGSYGFTSSNFALGQAALFPNLGSSVNYSQPSQTIGFIEVSDNTLLNPTGDFTIFTAIKPAGSKGWYQKIYWKFTDFSYGRGTYYLDIDISSMTLRARVNSSSTYYDAAYALTAGTVYFVGQRRLGTEMSLWVGAAGGTFAKQATATLPSAALLDVATNPFYYGNANNSGSDGFNGIGSQFVLFPSGLSDADMAAAFTAAG